MTVPTPILFANDALSTLASALSNVSTTLSVQSGAGALFPSPAAGQYSVITLYDAATNLVNEIMHMTARSGDTMTVVRAQEGTTALNWLPGDLVQGLITAGTMATIVEMAQGAGVNTVGFSDQKASGTAGGVAANATWTARALNTVLFDPGNLNGSGVVTLSANQLVLGVGTFKIEAHAPCNANRHMLRIYNVTDSAALATGTSENCVSNAVANPDWSRSFVEGVITITTGTKTLAFQHYAGTLYSGSPASDDLGHAVSASGTPETYLIVNVYQLSA